MKDYASKVAQKNFGAVLKEIKNGAVKVTKNGKPYAVVLSVADYQKLVWFNDGYWEREATGAEKDGCIGKAEMVDWISEKLNIPLHKVEDIVFRRTKNENTNCESFEIAEPTIKIFKQVKNFLNEMSRNQFIKYFTEVMKLSNRENDHKGTGFYQHEFGRFKTIYKHSNECLSLIYIGRR